MKLYDFAHDPALCAGDFDGPTWATWRIIMRLWDGDAARLSAEEQAVARKLIGREALPDEAPSQLFIGAGRRSGKTRFDALVAVAAGAQDYRSVLAKGEWATISCHCCDKRQARTWFSFCVGMIEASDLLKSEVANITAETIEFAHRTRIEVHTSSFRSIRGYSLALAVLDEAAFMRDEYSASPDTELYRALLPALATLKGRLIVTSSLHRKTGLMWNAYRQHYGAAA